MLDLGDCAKASIALESYIFRSDEVGERFADRLVAAVERGVDVRLLLDWIGARVGREWTTGVHTLHRSRWRDTAVKVDGPAAHDMIQAFDHMWRRATGKERRGSHRFLRRPARGAHLDPATDTPALVGIVEGC